ncbi:MAG: iron oxidase [Candidatus Eremiobacteraeota bacterium]|nr:iron oxidase [Candidatus Eremiobacteraeota bacterium]
MDDDKTISRAGMIEKLAIAPLAIGALAALRAEAEAAASIDQKTAQYVLHPVGGKECDKCSLFIPGKGNGPAACKLVKGRISPKGYCKFFSPKK